MLCSFSRALDSNISPLLVNTFASSLFCAPRTASHSQYNHPYSHHLATPYTFKIDYKPNDINNCKNYGLIASIQGYLHKSSPATGKKMSPPSNRARQTQRITLNTAWAVDVGRAQLNLFVVMCLWEEQAHFRHHAIIITNTRPMAGP